VNVALYATIWLALALLVVAELGKRRAGVWIPRATRAGRMRSSGSCAASSSS
jgi:hypothetical protein